MDNVFIFHCFKFIKLFLDRMAYVSVNHLFISDVLHIFTYVLRVLREYHAEF